MDMTVSLPEFLLEVRPDRQRVVLAVRGEIDISTAPRVRDALDELLADGWKAVVMDLREVAFMDSTGVLLLVQTVRRAADEGWSFQVVDGPPAVSRVLALTGADELLTRIDRVSAP